MNKKSVDTITFEVDKKNYLFTEDRISEELYSIKLDEYGSIELVFNPFRDEFTIRQHYDNNGYEPEVYEEFTLDDKDFDDLLEEDQLLISKFICKVYAQNPIRVYQSKEDINFEYSEQIEEAEKIDYKRERSIEFERQIQDIKEEIEKGGDYE